MKKLNYEKVSTVIKETLKNYVVKNNLKSLVIGVSGGIDSAVVCVLAKSVCEELNIPLIGRSITIQTNKKDEIERSIKIGNSFCSDFEEISLDKQFESLKEIDGDAQDNIDYKIRMGNIKARMRMIYLYNLASKNKGIVLGTENKTENYLGFMTIGGDGLSDFEPIVGLWKTEVYELAEYLLGQCNIFEENSALDSCILCNATDGLGISTTDLDQILPDWKNRHKDTRSGYKEVDEIFETYFDLFNKLNTANFAEKNNIINLIGVLKQSPVIQRHFSSVFKRNHPFTILREGYEYFNNK